MALVPLSYNLRSLWVRKGTTFMTALGMGATVAVVAGILSLQQGLQKVFAEGGQSDLVVFLRPGSKRESESSIREQQGLELMKTVSAIALSEDQQPLASGEFSSAVRRYKLDGGETNVPVRGVQPMTFTLRGEALRIEEGGRRFEPGTDEVIVGKRLVGRIRDCQVGEVLTLNVTPFRVVGVLDTDGPAASEIWGDHGRITQALEKPAFTRILARLKDGTDVEAFKEAMKEDKRFGSTVLTEPEFNSGQTGALSITLIFLGGFLGVVMGVAAIFTATNTMLAALASRTGEIGVLLSLGFRPIPIFVSFLFESVLIGLLGGVLGSLLVIPIHGIETGTTNWDTFTEIAFSFQITPVVLATAITYAVGLGLIGGAWPAFRAARMKPTDALRRR